MRAEGMGGTLPVIPVVSLQVQTSFQAVPLGAACIVSSLRSDPILGKVCVPQLLDYSLEEGWLAGAKGSSKGALLSERILADIAKTYGDAPVPCVLFSLYVWNRIVLEDCAREIKRGNPHILLIAGGPEITAAPESDAFDGLILGEGETAARETVKAIIAGKPLPGITQGKTKCLSEDCSTLSSPWLDGTLDHSPSVKECRGALWELARGCPYACAYCYESKGDKKVRLFPLSRLEKELDHFVCMGIERVFVLDPTYNASRDRALSILRLIEKKAQGIHFNFEVRAELLDRELVAAFARIPCSLQIGLQSTNQEALALVNRPADLKNFAKKIALLNEAGIVFGLDLMYGLPADTLTGFRSSLDWALALYPNNMEIFRLAVLPGTALSDKASGLGLDWKKEPPYTVNSTGKFSAQDLERAASLAKACDVFYTQGRAVTWFLSLLHALKLKPSQFLQDFGEFLGEKKSQETLKAAGGELTQLEAERLQLEFVQRKAAQKQKVHLLPIMCDVIRINGAWTRALAEGEETHLDLSWHPEDLFSGDAMDMEYFLENVCMENCSVRVFPTPEGPDFEME